MEQAKGPPMTLTKERVAELENGAKASSQNALIPFWMVPREMLALLSAYRTREAAIAECEAWRANENRGSTDWARQVTIEGAMAATDAARREEGQ